MAKEDYQSSTKILLPVGGMDESVQVVDSDVTFARVHGVSPFYLATLQRIFGKKLIDYNPEQSLMGIVQAFNEFGQYGYYVQTMEKLYYHLCEAPPDFHIDFTISATLGTDENNFSLGIYGQRRDGSQPPNPAISCLFGFPDRPVPPPDPEEGTMFENFKFFFNVLLGGSNQVQITGFVFDTNFFVSWIWNNTIGWVCWIVDTSIVTQHYIHFPMSALVGQEFALQVKVKQSDDLSTIRITPTVDGNEGTDILTALGYVDFNAGPTFAEVIQLQYGALGSQIQPVDFSFKELTVGLGLPHSAEIFDSSPLNTVVPPFDGIFTNLGGTPVTAAAGVMTVAYPTGSPRFATAFKTSF